MVMDWQLAELNIARLRAPMDDPATKDFADGLDEINALAESSPGFVWRLQTEDGNATAIKAFKDELVITNLSVWDSVDALTFAKPFAPPDVPAAALADSASGADRAAPAARAVAVADRCNTCPV